jgi:hypothetical protein
MAQPVKLSDNLVEDARLAGNAMQRSIAGQVEFWARIGRSVELSLTGEQIAKLANETEKESLHEILSTFEPLQIVTPAKPALAEVAYPQFVPHPTRDGWFLRIEEDGTRVLGKFKGEVFLPQARKI